MRKAFLGALISASLVAGQAQAACWTPAEVEAARVRSLDTMLMVASLGCRTWSGDVARSYNMFVEQNRGTLLEANARLRHRFSQEFGRVDAVQAYDEYVTRVANRFGGGVEGLDCGDFADIADRAIAEGNSLGSLAALARDVRVEPVLDDRVCDIAFTPDVF